MKGDKLIDAIGMVDEELVKRASIPQKKNNVIKIRWISSVAAILVVAITLSVFLPQINTGVKPPSTDAQPVTENVAIATEVDDDVMIKSEYRAQYPIMAQYNSVEAAWYEDKQERISYFGAGKNLDNFFKKTVSEFLSNSNGKNKLYSPLNVYMALAIVAECTDSNTRQQILDLLGSQNITNLRTQAHSIWNANYCDDGLTKSILASSLWLSDDRTFNEQTIEKIVEKYYASTFIGEMGSEEFNQTYRDWLNEQTGNLLKDQIDKKKLDPDVVMAIATTLYYEACWDAKFSKSETKEGEFHTKNGTQICDFMNDSCVDNYYWGEKFSAVGKSTIDGGEMIFILPNEDVDVESLLNDEETLDFMMYDYEWDKTKNQIINLSVPKFDVSSELKLEKNLMNLGITDCFYEYTADFSPLLSDRDVYISQVNHGIRVSIDEDGVTGAAYTEILVAGGGIPTDEIDFIVDRPFIFVVKSADRLPLFVGIVNEV